MHVCKTKKYIVSFVGIYIILSIIFIYILPMSFCKFIMWLSTCEENSIGVNYTLVEF